MKLPYLLTNLSNATRTNLLINYIFKICTPGKDSPKLIYEHYAFIKTNKKATDKTRWRFPFLHSACKNACNHVLPGNGEIYIWRKEELFDAGSRNQNNVREKVLYMGALYGIIWDGFEFFFMQSPETLTPETILNAKCVSTCWQRIVGLQQQYTKTKNTSYL